MNNDTPDNWPPVSYDPADTVRAAREVNVAGDHLKLALTALNAALDACPGDQHAETSTVVAELANEARQRLAKVESALIAVVQDDLRTRRQK